MELDESLAQINGSGSCVLPGVIPAGRCAELGERVTQAVAARGRLAAPGGMNFLAGVINHEQSFAPYLADGRVLGLVTALLGGHVRISFTSAIINPPGSPRGGWHADWPFNQHNAGHVPAPYPDAVMHLTTLWMLSPFSAVNGGTLVLPGSHRQPTNPTAADGGDPRRPLPGEVHLAGPAGAVCVMDSRLWHATSPNSSGADRVALVVRYAPWWLNLEILRPGSDERKRLVEEAGKEENVVPSVPRDVFERLPPDVKPLYRHWVEGGPG
jgi:hypothetical protein